MKIHEFQAKELFASFDIPIPPGRVVDSAAEARTVAEEIGFPAVVKAQVLVGGRGKAGGIKLANSGEEAAQRAQEILGMSIKGIEVKRVLVEKAARIAQEYYAGMIIDRSAKLPVLMISPAGGVDIEEIARETPEKILKLYFQPHLGMLEYQIRKALVFLGLGKDAYKDLRRILRGLQRTFFALDSSLAEINPLVLTEEGRLLACDAKINFDDNALFRHPQLEELRDEGEEEPLEVLARKKRINYVKLEGNIGCMVNGAGLAMATMDLIKHYGGEPANFLDIGGGAGTEQVAEAMRIITADENVRAIFINIFGGIVRCDRVAEGILQALEQTNIELPIVLRLTGTNEEIARELLKDTPLIALPTMSEAAQKVVEVVK